MKFNFYYDEGEKININFTDDFTAILYSSYCRNLAYQKSGNFDFNVLKNFKPSLEQLNKFETENDIELIRIFAQLYVDEYYNIIEPNQVELPYNPKPVLFNFLAILEAIKDYNSKTEPEQKQSIFECIIFGIEEIKNEQWLNAKNIEITGTINHELLMMTIQSDYQKIYHSIKINS